MKKPLIFLSLLIALTTHVMYSQSDSIDYLGQTPPGKTITKFAQGIVSTGSSSYLDYVTFSQDGNEMFFINNGLIKYSRRVNGEWQPLSNYNQNNGYEPVFAPCEGLLYWWTWNDENSILKFSLKTDTGWSDLINSHVNGTSFISASNDSILYFKYQGNGVNEIYYSKFNGIDHETIKPLPYPVNYNPPFFKMQDPVIAHDGSYVIYSKYPSVEKIRMHVSFRKRNGQWTYPKSLKGYIPNPDNLYFDLKPTISPDGKYLFAIGGSSENNLDIYWVSTEVIEDARNDNFKPYLNRFKLIPDTIAYTGQEFTLQFSDSTFIDDNGNETLTLTAELSNGKELPDSLVFDPETNTLFGKLVETGSYNIKITATDTAGASISDIFTLSVEQGTAIQNKDIVRENIIIYPNPADKKIYIKFQGLNDEVSYKILNPEGKMLMHGKVEDNTIDCSVLNSGLYLVYLEVNAQMVSKKIMIN